MTVKALSCFFILCISIFVLGIAGFQTDAPYWTIIIGVTALFIIMGCLISKRVKIRFFLITFLIGSSLLGGLVFERHLLVQRLYSFDLDQDGIFSELVVFLIPLFIIPHIVYS